jgi:5-methylcytosine-specific restriction enzyme A
MKLKRASLLIKFYKLNIRQGYGHVKGSWYHPLKKFPGAYFDGDGYIVFQNEKDFRECERLVPDRKTITVRGGLSSMPG